MLDWEEGLFLGIKSACRRFFWEPEKRRLASRAANLENLRGGLVGLGRLLSGRAITIVPSDASVLRCGVKIFLPVQLSLFETPALNERLLRMKLILAALSIAENWPAGEESELNGSRAEALFDRYPGLKDEYCFFDATAEMKELGGLATWFGAIYLEPELTDKEAGEGFRLNEDEEVSSQEAVTEVEGKSQYNVEVLDSQGSREEEAVPIHTFEKSETLEEYSGLNRKLDDEDELEDEKEALDKLEMKHLIRSTDRPKSIYRSDVVLQSGEWLAFKEEEVRGLPYPEWDYKKRAYRKDWCWVQEGHHRDSDESWSAEAISRNRKTIHQLKRHLYSLASDRLRVKRQPSGDDWDLDAVVQAQVDLALRRSPSERLYEERRRQLPDLSLMILLDCSYSTDAYVANRRALDVIRESVLCLGEAAGKLIPEFCVATFASKTRNSCFFDIVKEFDSNWEEKRAGLGRLQPEGYTRIGPALRHGMELLSERRSHRRGILLLTDGIPCDYDRYEGKYGIKDVAKCVEEAHAKGISTFALAVEERAKESFPMMFPAGRFRVIGDPGKLPEAMLAFCEKALLG